MLYQGIHGVSITLNFDNIERATQVFEALAEGGTVTMPFSDTLWAKKLGVVKDRFGCHWIVNGEMIDIRLAA
jgi:PhnB protein